MEPVALPIASLFLSVLPAKPETDNLPVAGKGHDIKDPGDRKFAAQLN